MLLKFTSYCQPPSNPLGAFIMRMLTTYHKEVGITKQEMRVSLILGGGPAQTYYVLG